MSEQLGARRRAVLIAAAATCAFAALVVAISPPRPLPAPAERDAAAFTLREVLETDLAVRMQPYASPVVSLEIDGWLPPDGGLIRRVPYLRSDSREALLRTIATAERAGIVPSPGSQILLEKFFSVDPYADGRPQFRTYEVGQDVVIDASMLASALGASDPDTNRPIVLVGLTEAGADRFCDATRRLVGHKIATVVAEQVVSAPIVNSAICGGRLSITMGGAAPETQEQERDAFVTALGGSVQGFRDPTWWERTQPHTWPGKLLFIFGLGALGGFLTLLVIRFAAPQWSTPTRFAGAFPWRRMIVTLLAPLAIYLGSKLSLPFLNDVDLEFIFDRSGGWTDSFSIIALGVTPVLLAFVLVELVALVVPALRWRRHDPRGRIRLGQAVAVLALVLGFVQGYVAAIVLQSMSPTGADIAAPGRKVTLLIALTLATGSLLLASLAGLIREHGLGNGYGAIVVAAALFPLAGQLHVDATTALWLGRTALVALVTWAMLRARAGDGEQLSARVPLSGMSPVTDTAGILILLTLLAGFGVGQVLDEMQIAVGRLQRNTVALTILMIVSVAGWSWLFARPPRVPRRSWNRGFLITFAGLVAIWVVATFSTAVRPLALVDAGMTMLATAVVMDIVADLRARRQPLVPAAVLHQVQFESLVTRELGDVPHHFHASNLRTLLAFFGPFAPVIVLVPEAHGEAAREKLGPLLAPARSKLPEARTI